MHIKNHQKNCQLHRWSILVVLFFILSACGKDHPKLIQFKAFDQRFNTVLDTKDPELLASLSAMFFDRQQVNNVEAALSFDYLFDLTTVEGSQRWRCTPNGYCQQRLQGDEPLHDIYYLERYKELFRTSNIK